MDNLLLLFWTSLACVTGFAALQFTFIALRSREPLMTWFALLCYAGLFKLLISIAQLDARSVAEVVELDRWWFALYITIEFLLIRFLVDYTGREFKYLTYPIYGLLGFAFIANLVMTHGITYGSVGPELQFKTFSWGEQVPQVDFEFHSASWVLIGAAALQLTVYACSLVVLAKGGRRYGALILAIYLVWQVFWTLHEAALYLLDISWPTEIPMAYTSLPLLVVLMVFELSSRAAALEKTKQSLQETEQRYQQLVEYVGDGYFVMDAGSMEFIDVNQQACSMLGFRRDELLQLTFMSIAKNTDLDERREIFANLDPNTAITLDEMFFCRDGSELPVELRVGVVAVASRRLILAMARDNRARIAVEEQRRVLEVQIQHSQKLEALGTLSGGIAHDFNNILGAILGYADLALDAVQNTTRTREYVANIRDAGLRAKDLVKRILAFSRPVDEDVRTIRLDEVIDEALVMLKAIIPSNIDIQTQYADELSIRADASQIHQVIVGLCTNAAQAMEQTGGVIRVKLEALAWHGEANAEFSLPLPVGDYVHLTVSDTGPGMEPGVAQRAFDPFFTTKKGGQGTGLGLSIVHGIIKHCGGAIHIDPDSDEGATLHMFFPSAVSQSNGETLEEAPMPTGHEQILLVDDNKGVLETFAMSLRQLGYLVDPVDSSSTALRLFRNAPMRYDLLITDLAMPELTGDALIAAMKEIRPDLPAIICTGYNAMISEDRAGVLGIDTVLTKPVSRATLAIRTRDVLNAADPAANKATNLA